MELKSWFVGQVLAVMLFAGFVSQAHAVQPSSGEVADSIIAELSESDSLKSRPNTFKKKAKHAKNILYALVKSFDDYDTTYISPNYYNYSAMLQNTNVYQVYRFTAKQGGSGGGEQMLQFSPTPSLKVGPYIGWRWIFLGYTFDIGHMGKATKKTEFNLSLYSSMLGVDLVYIKNSGDFRILRTTGFDGVDRNQFRGTEFDGMNANLASINAYYVFNHRHFSYPAAFSQSTVQRKSCGSLVLGMKYDHHNVKFDYTRLPSELVYAPDGKEIISDQLKFSKINYNSYSISFGYAYNWAFARNCLFAVSLTPAIGFKKAKGEHLRGNEIWIDMKNMNFDFISRAGLVWNNTHWFAGASLITHLYDYRKDRLSLSNAINYLNIYVGFNFNRKKQYRNRR